MPRIARTEQQMQADRDRIVRTALDIIHGEGYAHLSLKKIASRLGMTAPSIYYYFSNKDELNIEMRRLGFTMLYERLLNASTEAVTFEGRIKCMMEAYVGFATENPHHYELLLILPTPDYSDYVGTPMEDAAARERNSSMRVFEFITQSIQEFASAGGRLIVDTETTILIIWSVLHGICAIQNGKPIKQIYENSERAASAVIDGLMETIKERMPARQMAAQTASGRTLTRKNEPANMAGSEKPYARKSPLRRPAKKS